MENPNIARYLWVCNAFSLFKGIYAMNLRRCSGFIWNQVVAAVLYNVCFCLFCSLPLEVVSVRKSPLERERDMCRQKEPPAQMLLLLLVPELLPFQLALVEI